MSVLVKVEQRSPEWHKWKQWKIGGSHAPIIMNESPWETPLQLYQRIVEGIQIEMNADIQRGIDLESEALDLLNARLVGDFVPSCFQSIEHPWAICSADGWSNKFQMGCELKAPRRFSESLNTCPIKYKAQIQHCMMVTDSINWIYAEYVQGELWHCVIPRDKEYIKRLIEKEKEFFERLMNFSKPSHEFESEWNSLL